VAQTPLLALTLERLGQGQLAALTDGGDPDGDGRADHDRRHAAAEAEGAEDAVHAAEQDAEGHGIDGDHGGAPRAGEGGGAHGPDDLDAHQDVAGSGEEVEDRRRRTPDQPGGHGPPTRPFGVQLRRPLRSHGLPTIDRAGRHVALAPSTVCGRRAPVSNAAAGTSSWTGERPRNSRRGRASDR
jgi:hypothetical protein